MPTVSETTLVAALPQSVATSFGTIVPSFEQLLGYVDASLAPVGARIQWKLYAISGGVRALAAVSDPIASGPLPYIVFDVPNVGNGRGTPMIAGTTYEMVAVPLDPGVVNVKAGFVGYDVEANTQPNEVASAAHPLVFGAEVAFGSLAAHHVRVQVQFDAEVAPVLTGTTDITAGGLYGGGGTLNATNLNITINGVTTNLVFNGATNSASEAAMLAAINAAFPGLTATQGGPGGNKLVLTGNVTSQSIIINVPSFSLAFLGLVAGTFSPVVVPNTASQVRVYGTITGTAGSITALLAVGVMTDAEGDPSIPIDLMGLGFVTAQLKIFSTNSLVGAGAVTAVIIGADLNLDIGGGGVVLLANNAYAAGIIYRPGGTAWTQTDPNVFPLWGGPFPSVMAALALTQAGNVNIEIDDSITTPAPIPSTVGPFSAAAMPVGGWDMQNRVTLTNDHLKQTVSIPLSMPDGSTLKNLAGLRGVRLQSHAQLAGSNLPSLSYTINTALLISETASIDAHFAAPAATRPIVDIGAGLTLSAIVQTFSALNPAAAPGAEIFNLLSAGSLLSLSLTSASVITPAKNVVAGAGSFFFIRDRTASSLVTSASFTGGTPTFLLREGLDNRTQVIIAAVTYVVDAAAFGASGVSFDELILCKPTGAGTTIIDLPDATLPMNLGRVIQIVDDNGTSNANTISLVPFGAQNLNGANALKALSSSWGTWFATCDGAQWVVSQSAGI